MNPLLRPEVTKCLQLAKSLLEHTGWCQHVMREIDAKGSACAYCAAGAILVGCGDYGYDGHTMSEALMRLRESNGIQVMTCWNDMAGRRKSEILDAFDKAINYNGIAPPVKRILA